VSQQSQQIALRADNLALASMSDKLWFKAQETKAQITAFSSDPRMRQQAQRIYNLIDHHLPSTPVNIHPEHLVVALFGLFLILLKIVGLSKTIMALSLLSITVVVALPDIVTSLTSSGTNTPSLRVVFQTVARNFPLRWKEVVSQTTGWTGISHRMALAIWVVLLLATGKLLVTPTVNSRRNITSRSDGDKDVWHAEHLRTDAEWTLEDIYKLGFDDATKTLAYGTSLPSKHEEFIIQPARNIDFLASKASPSRRVGGVSNVEYDDYDDRDFYDPAPKKRVSNK